MVSNLERKCSENWYKGIWGRGIWIDLPEWAKNENIFVLHVNAHQKGASADEDFNNPMDRMTYFVDLCLLMG